MHNRSINNVLSHASMHTLALYGPLPSGIFSELPLKNKPKNRKSQWIHCCIPDLSNFDFHGLPYFYFLSILDISQYMCMIPNNFDLLSNISRDYHIL